MGVGRVERLVYGWFIGVVTVAVGVAGGLVMLLLAGLAGAFGSTYTPGWALPAAVGAVALLVGGPWLARRVGTGRISKAGWVITGALAAILGVAGVVLLGMRASRGTEGIRLVVGLGFGAAAVFIAFGLTLMLRVRRYTPGLIEALAAATSVPPPPVRLVAAGPTWMVAEPGADLKEYQFHDEPMTRLGAGTLLREVRRWEEQVRVVTLGGLEGWVDADRLEPTGDGKGSDDG